ncbi:Uncharacterised protein [Klebsiella pneumoniae]|nr:Uncharacterised protein [Klebsiella pneumoniae]
MVCVVGRMRDLILQLSKSSIYSTKPLCSTRLFPGAGWFERPDIIKHPVKYFCVCLQYTAETSPSTLHALVDEAGRQVAKPYIKGGHCLGSEGYTFCITTE